MKDEKAPESKTPMLDDVVTPILKASKAQKLAASKAASMTIRSAPGLDDIPRNLNREPSTPAALMAAMQRATDSVKSATDAMRPFHVRPDWPNWTARGSWCLSAAIALTLNLEPSRGLGRRISEELYPDGASNGSLSVRNREKALRDLSSSCKSGATGFILSAPDAAIVVQAADLRDIAISRARDLSIDAKWLLNDPLVLPKLWALWVRDNLPHIKLPPEIEGLLQGFLTRDQLSQLIIDQRTLMADKDAVSEAKDAVIAAKDARIADLESDLENAVVRLSPADPYFPPELDAQINLWRKGAALWDRLLDTLKDGKITAATRALLPDAVKSHPDMALHAKITPGKFLIALALKDCPDSPDVAKRRAIGANWAKEKGNKSYGRKPSNGTH